MLLAVLLFSVGLVFLIKGGDWFVDGAVGIAERFHVPDLLIGATVVSIGTTLPEVMVSANSAVTGHGEIAYGNAIGSVICNTALIAALTIAVAPTVVDKSVLKKPTVFFFAAAAFYSCVAYFLGEFSRWVGIVLFLCFVVYIILSVRDAVNAGKNADDEEMQAILPLKRALVLLVVGAVLIASGADLLVENGTLIAKGLGVPESVIALTFVALGTSLPELVTAVTALIKGRGVLSLGNIIGANLFNIVLVTGVSASLCPFAVPQGNTVMGISSSLLIDIPVMLSVMALLCLPALKNGRLSRWQGIILLMIYFSFCIFQFVL